MTFRPFNAAFTGFTGFTGLAALALATGMGLGLGTAQAATQTSAPQIVSGSFTDLALDTFALTGPANTIVGSFEWGAGTINLSFGTVTFTTNLASGTVNQTTLGSWTDLDAGPGYRFENIGPGSYALKVSGSVAGVGALRALSTVSAVPEPAGGSLLLAGVGALALLQRRRVTPR